MAVDITLTGPGKLSDWNAVVAKAATSGIDPNSLYIGTDGLVYGKTQSFTGTDGTSYAGGTWSILGNWGGDPNFYTGAPPGVANGSPTGGAWGSGKGLFSLPSIPWWVWALIAVGVIVVIREA
jgi:hypothetical protein